jgi:hypothetical protein
LKEIPISKRNLVIGLILAVVIALGILAIQLLPLHTASQPPSISPDEILASGVATTALEAFFRVDYQEGQETWLTRICASSTSSGCQFISAGAGKMWGKFQEAKANVSATVSPDAKVAETAREQVWKMSVTLSSPLPGSNKIQDIAYVAVIKTDNGWKFDRFLLEPEIKAILTRQALTVSPEKENKLQ